MRMGIVEMVDSKKSARRNPTYGEGIWEGEGGQKEQEEGSLLWEMGDVWKFSA